jgi:hypothetical protein
MFLGKKRVRAAGEAPGYGSKHAEKEGRRERREGPTPSRDLPQPAKTHRRREDRGGERVVVWRMRSYERGRRGNALRGGAGNPREAGNTRPQAKGLSVSGGPGKGNTVWTLGQGAVTTSRRVESEVYPRIQGVYTGKRVSIGVSGKVLRGYAAAANRTREI